MSRHFDPTADDVDSYRLLTSLVVPRPIAWVCSRDQDGVGNLAPHSFFTVASSDPPIVSVTSIGRKDTLHNVTATGEFSISLAPRTLLEQVNDSSARFEPHQDEAAELGIEIIPSQRIGPGVVAGSPASLECRLERLVDLGSSVLMLGRVVWISIDESVLDGGHPSYERLDVVSRLGGDEWGLRGPTRSVPRPRRPADIARRD